jgi:hypothetical protein
LVTEGLLIVDFVGEGADGSDCCVEELAVAGGFAADGEEGVGAPDTVVSSCESCAVVID